MYVYTVQCYIHIVKPRNECEVVCIAEKYKKGNILFLIENVRASKYYYTIFFSFHFIYLLILLLLLLLLLFFLAHCNITY